MPLHSFYKLLILSLLALVAAITVWIVTPEYTAGKFFGEPLIPGLIEKVNEAAVISVERDGRTTTFMRDANGNWSLMEADHYPADKERIRNALIGLANLEKVEPKTALPEFYPDLQVEDNMTPGAKSYLVTLLDEDGKQMLSLLIGKQTRGISWNGQGYFVRFPNDAQSWLVRGNVDVTGDMRSWIATRLLPLVPGRTASVTIVDGSKTREAVYKRTNPNMLMAPVFLSDGYFVIDENFISNMENALTSFDFSDVSRRPENLSEETPFTSAFIETFDGLNIYLFLYLIDGKPFAALSFAPTDQATDEVKKEAAALEKKHAPWLYMMPEDTVSALLPFMSVPEKQTDKKASGKKNPSKEATKKKK